MPNRQSIQTDQPKASMTGVVRVAVPVPVSNKYWSQYWGQRST